MRILKYFNHKNHSSDNFLGGHGNNDGGLPGVMIAGNGITAAIPNALHINGLWANGLPTVGPNPAPPPVGLPVNSVYIRNLGPMQKALYIV